MTFLEILLGIVCFLLFVLSVVSIRLLYRTSTTLLRVQDTLEESLETIDERIESVEKILEVPLFSDSPEIKRLRKDMLECREAMLDIAYSLSGSMSEQDNLTDPEVENQ